MTAGARSRIFLDAKTDVGQAESIALTSQGMPFNAVILMWSWNASAVPLTAEDLVVSKDSIRGPAYDLEFFRQDPSVLAVQDIECTYPWQLRRGDKLVITYANTDDETIGVEVVIGEAK
jgi:hypothetical protein